MLTKKLKNWFGSAVRARGESYASSGRVRELRVTRHGVTATVRGSSDYDVRMVIDDEGDEWTLYAKCDCPFAEDHADLCKHMWAVLVKAEGRIEERFGAEPSVVDVGSAYDVDEDVWELLEEEAAEGAAEVYAEPARREAGPGPSKPAGPPGWLKQMRQVLPTYAVRASAHEAAGEVVYVLDVERSRVQRTLVLALHHRPVGSTDAGVPKPKKLTLHAEAIPRLPDARDRVICGMLAGAGMPSRKYADFDSRGNGESGASLWHVNPKLAPVVLPLMQETGRLFWRASDGGLLEPLRWAGEEEWELVVRVEGAGSGGGELRCEARACGGRVGGPVVLQTGGDPGAVLSEGVLSPLVTRGCELAASWINASRLRGVKREHVGHLVNELSERGISLPIEWPEGWGVREERGVVPRGRLTIRNKRATDYGVSADAALLDVAFDYSGRVAAVGTRGEYVLATDAAGEEAGVLVRRDAAAEEALIAALEGAGARRNPYAYNKVEYQAPARRLAAMAAALMREGWEVRGEKGVYKRPGEFKVDVSSGIDWFNVRGGVTFEGGGTATIEQLLEALRRGEEFVTLGDGTLGMMPEEWLKKHAAWLSLGRVDAGEGVRFSKAQVGLIDALLAEMPEATCDAQVRAARERLAGFEGVKARREPVGFKGELRGYQREGLGWLGFLADFGFGGILADDMGLGKTVQLLAHIAETTRAARRRKAGERGAWLVVAPTSLVFNWAREAARFAPHLKVYEHAGLDRRRREGELDVADVVLTTYGTMRRDVEALRARRWACVVLDEAQMIKNADSQAAKAARLVGASADRRLALTGTPVENRLGDLWSIMEFLNPGMLGSAGAFRAALSSTEGRGENGAADLGVVRRAMRPFILRRTKALVAPELPARSEQTIACELAPAQRKLYDGLLDHYRRQLLGVGGLVEAKGMNRSRMHVLEALLRLRQAACHTALIETKPSKGRRGAKDGGASEAASAKLDTLMEMLQELIAEGHRALVFSQFTSLLGLVRERLEAEGITHEYLDGGTAPAERRAGVDRFQAAGTDGARVFLISLKAGGVGLNLTAAEYVFLLDPWWNPAVEAQAIDRTHRIGQSKTVMAYRLIARGTIEERIQELQASKRELAAAIIGEDAGGRSGPLASLTKDELGWLLGGASARDGR